jgi:hypothetical protein
MSSAKQPTDPERDRNGDIRLMLNGIHDRALERSGRLRGSSHGFAMF